jgi:O-antigen/teichoic acid export membrane protein
MEQQLESEPIEAPQSGLAGFLGPLRRGGLRSFFSKADGDRGRERYRRVSLTASTSLASKAVTIAISFISVPLTVHYLGAERYGVWLTLSSLLTWMAMTDFGLAGNALVNLVSEANGRDDRQLAREHTASAFWALTGMGAAIGLAFAVAFPWIPWHSVFQTSSAVPPAELSWACGLTLAMFAVGLPFNMLYSVYSAYQDGFVSNLWSMASNLSALVGLLVVTHFHGGLPVLILALSGTRNLINAANACYLFGFRYRWLTPSPGAVTLASLKRLFGLGGQYMITQLASLGIYQSQPMLITQMLGPAQVTVFVVAQKIITLPNDLSYMATAPFISAYSEAKARGDWNWIRGAFRKSTLACTLIGVILCGVIGVCAKPLIRVWAGPAAVPSTALILWLSIYTVIGVILQATGQMLCGLERVGKLALSLVLCSFAVIGLSIVFARGWGLSGVALAMAVAKLLTFVPIQLFEVRQILSEIRLKRSNVGAEQVA